MKSPLTELKDYCDKVDEMEYMDDPGDVVNKLLQLISKLPSLSSAEESIGERKFTLKEALDIITEAMREDKSEGSYYYSWQANIAMAFKDECDRDGSIDKSNIPFSKIHEIANNAAKNFLNTLIQRIP